MHHFEGEHAKIFLGKTPPRRRLRRLHAPPTSNPEYAPASERSERSVRFNPNLRSERVRYFSERETNLQALKRLISL